MKLGKSVAMIKQIRKLSQLGYSIRGIARSLGISRNTVRAYLRQQAPEPQARDERLLWAKRVDWQAVLTARSKGVTLKQLHREYAPEGTGYDAFCRYIRNHLQPAPLPTTPLVHKPGEKVQIDYCDGVRIVDPRTGRERKTWLFCAVLPFSGYTFGEFVFDQKLPSFIKSHQKMWAYFNGVTPYVVVDNLKSGVTKAHIYDPDINQTYCDYANHDGFAVLPARPKKPRDKAAIESTIGAIQRSFFQEIRNEKFYHIGQLNDRFRSFLEEFNSRVMKDYQVSRCERFDEERKYLNSLPEGSYVLKTWRTAKVHPDATIQIDKNFYSVPYAHIGKVVRVRISDDVIEVFSESMQAITCHKRLKNKVGCKSIKPEHYPNEKIQAARFDIRKAIAQAKAVGPKMEKLFQHFFSSPRPLENLRKAQGILRCLKIESMTPQAMEYAASQCLTFKRFRVDYFRSCAKHLISTGKLPIRGVPVRDREDIYLHGRIERDDRTG